MPIFRLFLLFVKIGAILLGGGYVILPILSDEFCEKRKLITHDELVDFFTLSQSLPGIIAANISIFIGYKIRGILGAITAVIGIIFIPFWTIIILASILEKVTNNSLIQYVLWGISIAVIVLIILTIREIWQKTNNKNWEFYLIFTTSLILLKWFSPIQVIIISSILGVLIKRIWRIRE